MSLLATNRDAISNAKKNEKNRPGILETRVARTRIKNRNRRLTWPQ